MESPQQTQEDQADKSELVEQLRNEFKAFVIGSYLRSLLANVSTGKLPKMTIQLIGKLGHGKSELINSCICVVSDKPYENKAGAINSTQAVTTKRMVFPLTRNIRICDNRGLPTLTNDAIYEIEDQLRGKRGDLTKEVTFETSFFSRLFGWKTAREEPDNLYVPVIVFKCDCPDAENFVSELDPLIRAIKNICGRTPVIVLTGSKGKSTASVKQAFNDCSCHDILPVENYTEENSQRTHDQDVAILTFLLRCLKFVQDESTKSTRI